MSGNEEIGKVFSWDLASDLCVVAGGTCRFEDGAVVGGINPDVLKVGVA